jgi:hypothetical protein
MSHKSGIKPPIFLKEANRLSTSVKPNTVIEINYAEN